MPVTKEDQCVYDESQVCNCWVRLANGVLCPFAPENVPEVIDATPVLSFECPKCSGVMLREPPNNYRCITASCVYNGVLWKPEPWEMKRVE